MDDDDDQDNDDQMRWDDFEDYAEWERERLRDPIEWVAKKQLAS